MSTDRWALAERSADLEDGPFDVVRTRDEALATDRTKHCRRERQLLAEGLAQALRLRPSLEQELPADTVRLAKQIADVVEPAPKVRRGACG